MTAFIKLMARRSFSSFAKSRAIKYPIIYTSDRILIICLLIAAAVSVTFLGFSQSTWEELVWLKLN
jgi:hypothetical protein